MEVVSVDSNGEGTNLVESDTHGVFGISSGSTLSNIDERGNGNETLGGIVIARAINSLVGVVRFSFELSRFQIGEGVIHQTTIATLIFLGITVNQLLFRERS